MPGLTSIKCNMSGKTRVMARMVNMKRKALSHLPTTNSKSRMGAVSSNSNVPMRASSEIRRIVRTGVVNTSRKQNSQVIGLISGGGAPENACDEVANTITAK